MDELIVYHNGKELNVKDLPGGINYWIIHPKKVNAQDNFRHTGPVCQKKDLVKRISDLVRDNPTVWGNVVPVVESAKFAYNPVYSGGKGK